MVRDEALSGDLLGVVRESDQGLEEALVSEAPALDGGLEGLGGPGQGLKAGVLPQDDVLLETPGGQAGRA